MAAKARLAELSGFAPDGLTIENPEQYVNSVLMRLVNQIPRIIGQWRKINPPTLEEYTGPADELTTLIEMPKDNMKQFVEVPEVGLRRLSASAISNCCWFDAFLQCMSVQYNNLPLNDRVEVRKRFRKWCNEHVEHIIAQIPRDVFPTGPGGYLTDDEIRADLSDTEDEIDAQTGMFIAWYFGVNCIVVHRQAGEYLVECQIAYQSPECKTIVIYFENAHFEPMGKFAVASNNTMMNDKFLFDWSDTDLCLLKDVSMKCTAMEAWTEPTCIAIAGNGARNNAVNASVGNAATGTGATPVGTTPARAPMAMGNTPANPAAETVRKQLRFANNVVGGNNTPGGVATNGGYIIGAGGGAAEQRGGNRRRTRKRLIQKRRSQTKKRRTSRN
jgi:hypothetical protein